MARAEFQSEWQALGYGKGMGSAFLRPPEKHFIRAYHLTSAEHGISDISLRRLKVARFSEVNDPFELLGVNFHESKTRKTVRSFKDGRNNETGLLSFTANWTSPLLWSHYAAKHQGMCLGFDLRRSDNVQRVQYKMIV